MNLQYFCIFMYISWLLKLLGVFFVESLPNPVVMPELSNWSASNAWPVWTTKTIQFQQIGRLQPPLSPQAPSAILGALVYRGIPSDLRSRPEQSHHLPGLCSPDDYRQSIESSMGVPTFNSTEKALTFTIYDCILRIPSNKVCYLTKVSPLNVELI